MLFARAKRRPSFSLQSRDRPATHDPTAIHSARHDASNKERVEHAHLLDDTQEPNPGAISSRNIKCALVVPLDEGIGHTFV
jgi:hypothetical protein